jgi:hypothetical protein
LILLNQFAASFRPLRFELLADFILICKVKISSWDKKKLKSFYSSRRRSSETTRALTFGEEVSAFTFF